MCLYDTWQYSGKISGRFSSQLNYRKGPRVNTRKTNSDLGDMFPWYYNKGSPQLVILLRDMRRKVS